MIRNWTLIKVLALAAILLAACTQDELAEQGNTLPDGEYPLQIGSVSITAEASEEPWTRVTEKPDGSGSVFQGGERIGVRIAGSEETGIYLIKVDDAGNVTVSPDKPVYWKNTQTAEVTAWYPATDGALDLSGQDKGLVYVLRATADNASYDTPVSLQFKHQLAKVRVVTKGTADVGKIEIVGMPTGCNIQQGEIIGALVGSSRLPMRRTTYQDGTECWEANVVPGEEIQVFSVSGTNLAISRNCYISPYITPEAGNVHTIMLTVNSEGTQSIRLSTDSIGGNGTEQPQ